MGARHGRACFSVLLFQDLAVVVLLMLIPLLAPSPDGTTGGFGKIAAALGLAAVKAVVAVVGIIAGGRMVVQPLYKKISEFANAEIFAATTLLVGAVGALNASLVVWHARSAAQPAGGAKAAGGLSLAVACLRPPAAFAAPHATTASASGRPCHGCIYAFAVAGPRAVHRQRSGGGGTIEPRAALNAAPRAPLVLRRRWCWARRS